MEYRRLGRSGLKLSALSYGSWVTFHNQVDVDRAVESLALAYDHGVNFFDNAEGYAYGRSEEVMGAALAKLSWPRDRYCVSSKVYFGPVAEPVPTQRGLSRKHVMDACHQALQRLRVDYLDLYFCHRPDPDTPIGETVRAMHDLVAQGKVLYWGTSEWSAGEIAAAHAHARADNLTPPTMEQPEYNLFARHKVEVEYTRLYQEFGLGTTTWSPLASGLLSGKYADGVPQDSRFALPGYEWLRKRLESPLGRRQVAAAAELGKLAGTLGCSTAQLAIAWILGNPWVSTVILGASRPGQLRENLGALAMAEKLTPEIRKRIESISAA
ncbi:MAG: aldo/keto reductase [Gammaproteobacteria bacterium]|nr:aldo/keto reductase [Gammaproteobacteria bacterium]